MQQQCFRFNIPRDDDAHMIFVALPASMSTHVEEWFVNQVYELTKYRSEGEGSLPKKFPDQPDEATLKDLDGFLEESGRKSGVTLRIQKPNQPRPVKQQELSWFMPVVVNHVENFQQKIDKSWQLDNNAGYSICLENLSESNDVNVIFDVLLVSEDPSDDDTNGDLKAKHLTPLEEQLGMSISAANSILHEMRYMEKREARMRVTADSINSRIRIFSFISVAILLAVTYLQVTYLKTYFKKKKLM
jgi:p24 family protein delta-1